jgi:hypothetical protein
MGDGFSYETLPYWLVRWSDKYDKNIVYDREGRIAVPATPKQEPPSLDTPSDSIMLVTTQCELHNHMSCALRGNNMKNTRTMVLSKRREIQNVVIFDVRVSRKLCSLCGYALVK